MTPLDDATIIDTLANGPVYRFADWPNAMPTVAVGLYSVWKGDRFIYIGMAGRARETVLTEARNAGRACGLRDRLGSHASGRRSGDQFCVYVADRLVLPDLSPAQIGEIAAGRHGLDALVREYIHHHLTYRFFAFSELSLAEQHTTRRLERHIQAGETAMGKPYLNLLPRLSAQG